MHAITIFHSIYSSIKLYKSSIQLAPQSTIGVKDLRIVQVVKKFWDNNTSSHFYECELSFKDGTKVVCKITGGQINGLFNAQGFRREALKGISSVERCYDQMCHVKQSSILNHDAWAADLYKNA